MREKRKREGYKGEREREREVKESGTGKRRGIEERVGRHEETEERKKRAPDGGGKSPF